MEKALDANGMTLNSVLKKIGWTKSRVKSGKHNVYDKNGVFHGCFDAGDCWEYLRLYGKII